MNNLSNRVSNDKSLAKVSSTIEYCVQSFHYSDINEKDQFFETQKCESGACRFIFNTFEYKLLD